MQINYPIYVGDRTAGTAEQEKSAVLFLGMHRSGTSAAAGVFSRLGVDLGSDLMDAADDNPKGFYEHRGIVALHDEVLAVLDSRWDDPRPLPAGWERDPRLIPLRRRLRTILADEFSGKPLWGFKDPRLCRLLPLWLPLLHELRVTPRFVLVVRSPVDASHSLRRRDGILQERSSMLWLSYIVSAEQNTRTLPRTTLFYDDLLHDWRGEVAEFSGSLGWTCTRCLGRSSMKSRSSCPSTCGTRMVPRRWRCMLRKTSMYNQRTTHFVVGGGARLSTRTSLTMRPGRWPMPMRVPARSQITS